MKYKDKPSSEYTEGKGNEIKKKRKRSKKDQEGYVCCVWVSGWHGILKKKMKELYW